MKRFAPFSILLSLLSACASLPGGEPAALSTGPAVLHTIEQGEVVVHLLDAPCTDPKTSAMIRPEKLVHFKAIDSLWPEEGKLKRYAGCWREVAADSSVPEDAFFLVFSDGERFLIPQRSVKKERI